eukprot:4486556-Amphidinium_carterae.3
MGLKDAVAANRAKLLQVMEQTQVLDAASMREEVARHAEAPCHVRLVPIAALRVQQFAWSLSCCKAAHRARIADLQAQLEEMCTELSAEHRNNSVLKWRQPPRINATL